MNKNQLIFNVVIAICVVVIGYFSIFSTSENENSKLQSSINTNSGFSPKIAYVKSDSLLTNYLLFKELNSQFESMYKEKQAIINNEEMKFQKEYQNAEKQIRFLNEEELRILQTQLANKEQQLMSMQQQISNELAIAQQEMNLRIYDSIASFMDRYNLESEYSYVLGVQKGSGVLFARNSNDITNDVIEKINKEYLESKNN